MNLPLVYNLIQRFPELITRYAIATFQRLEIHIFLS